MIISNEAIHNLPFTEHVLRQTLTDIIIDASFEPATQQQGNVQLASQVCGCDKLA